MFSLVGGRLRGQKKGRGLDVLLTVIVLKSSAVHFLEHLEAELQNKGSTSSRADMDLWYKKVVDHYKYIGTYFDHDILAPYLKMECQWSSTFKRTITY